jgi:alpha-glucosidase
MVQKVSGARVGQMCCAFSSSSFSRLQEVLGNDTRLCEMARFNWKHVLFALSSLVSQGASQSSTSQNADGLTTAAVSKTVSYATATIDGTPTRFSVAFTVPAEADVGPNILPNIKDSNAKQAQQLCPGYTASNVQRNNYGFTASLSLAGEPVSSNTILLQRHWLTN